MISFNSFPDYDFSRHGMPPFSLLRLVEGNPELSEFVDFFRGTAIGNDAVRTTVQRIFEVSESTREHLALGLLAEVVDWKPENSRAVLYLLNVLARSERSEDLFRVAFPSFLESTTREPTMVSSEALRIFVEQKRFQPEIIRAHAAMVPRLDEGTPATRMNFQKIFSLLLERDQIPVESFGAIGAATLHNMAYNRWMLQVDELLPFGPRALRPHSLDRVALRTAAHETMAELIRAANRRKGPDYDGEGDGRTTDRADVESLLYNVRVTARRGVSSNNSTLSIAAAGALVELIRAGHAPDQFTPDVMRLVRLAARKEGSVSNANREQVSEKLCTLLWMPAGRAMLNQEELKEKAKTSPYITRAVAPVRFDEFGSRSDLVFDDIVGKSNVVSAIEGLAGTFSVFTAILLNRDLDASHESLVSSARKAHDNALLWGAFDIPAVRAVYRIYGDESLKTSLEPLIDLFGDSLTFTQRHIQRLSGETRLNDSPFTAAEIRLPAVMNADELAPPVFNITRIVRGGDRIITIQPEVADISPAVNYQIRLVDRLVRFGASLESSSVSVENGDFDLVGLDPVPVRVHPACRRNIFLGGGELLEGQVLMSSTASTMLEYVTRLQMLAGIIVMNSRLENSESRVAAIVGGFWDEMDRHLANHGVSENCRKILFRPLDAPAETPECFDEEALREVVSVISRSAKMGGPFGYAFRECFIRTADMIADEFNTRAARLGLTAQFPKTY